MFLNADPNGERDHTKSHRMVLAAILPLGLKSATIAGYARSTTAQVDFLWGVTSRRPWPIGELRAAGSAGNGSRAAQPDADAIAGANLAADPTAHTGLRGRRATDGRQLPACSYKLARHGSDCPTG